MIPENFRESTVGGRALTGEHFYRGEHFGRTLFWRALWGEHFFGEHIFYVENSIFFDGRAPDATLASSIKFSAKLFFGVF